MTGSRTAVMTMARNESQMLPRWLAYYGKQVGRENLTVLDDNTTDGSTDALGTSVLRLPPPPWKDNWMRSRLAIVNAISRALLQTYDTVVFTDVDEFLVPDPAKYNGLSDYLARSRKKDVFAPVGLNVLHDAAREPSIDPTRPVLEQRRLVKLAAGMCKPVGKRAPLPWTGGTHGIKSRFKVDPDLLLLHLKYYDEAEMVQVADQRRTAFEQENRGSRVSAWPLGGEELAKRLRQWVATPDGGAPRELETRKLALPEPAPADEKRGFFRVLGTQLEEMQDNELLALPERFRRVVI